MTLDVHPFIKSFMGSGFYNTLPPQMITYKEKVKGIDKRGISPWMRRNMDTFEMIGRVQYQQNLKLVENERLVNGEFIPQDYMEDCEDCDEDFFDPLQELTKDGGLPKFIKHYDIISTIIKTQVQEFTQLPDTFHVEGHGEYIQNDRMQVQKDELMKWINGSLEKTFNTYLKENELLKTEFASEEEQQQYQQEIAQLREERTPEEIGKMMKYHYRHFAEEWAEHELQDQKDRFNLNKLRRKEFLNYLTVGRRFRHLRVSSKGLNVEYENYVNIFYHKAPNTEYVQNGDYAGKIYVDTAAGIINRFAENMTEDEIKSFEYFSNLSYNQESATKDLFGNTINYTATDGNPYNTWMPSYSPLLNQLAPNLGMNWISSNPIVGAPAGLQDNNGYNNRLFVVTEAYWKGFRRKGRLCWINPVTQMYEVTVVDESFIVPDYVKTLKDATFVDEPEINTIVWAWEEQIWQGKKVNNYNIQRDRAPIYFDIKPCEYQGVSKYQMYNKKLPIVGQIANNLNTRSTNQVDMIKPYQFLFNIAMNKAFKYMQKSLAAFLAMEIKNLPNQKGWGGEDALVKWVNATEETQIGLLDTSPSNTLGANSGGTLPKVIDVDNTPKVVAHMNIANSIRQLAMAQLGFSPQRLGDVEGIDTATGLNMSVAKSYNATGSWFTEFWECEGEILKQQLDAAQWLQANNKDFTALLSKGIISDSFLRINNSEFDLYDLRIYITNSQEELRQLEIFKKLAIELNTQNTSMSSRMQMAGLNNAQLILQIVKDEEDKALKLQREMQALEQQRLQTQDQLEFEKLAWEKEALSLELENNLEEAWIRALGHSQLATSDEDTNDIPDAFEYEKFNSQAEHSREQLGVQKDKLALDRDKERNRRLERQQELQLKIQDLDLKRRQIEQTARNVKILGDKSK